MIGFLPKSLDIEGKSYDIDSDFRTALLIMQMYNDRALSDFSKHIAMLNMLFTTIPEGESEPVTIIPDNIELAIEKAIWFLNVGQEPVSNDFQYKVIDYKQDEQMLFSAVNAVANKEVRAEPYMHWWTFYGLCQSIDENSLISHVIAIRLKKAKGKKLNKQELAFYRENRQIIDFKTSLDDYEALVAELRRDRR